jgi:hypothetical protein
VSIAHPNKSSLRSYHKRAALFKALGLNAHGTEYRRRQNLKPEERAAHYRKANLDKWHRLSQRRFMAGQTSRGTKRVYSIVLPVTDIARLDSEIELLGHELASIYDSLPPTAQARVVALGRSISNLKSRIQVVNQQENFKRS